MEITFHFKSFEHVECIQFTVEQKIVRMDHSGDYLLSK